VLFIALVALAIAIGVCIYFGISHRRADRRADLLVRELLTPIEFDQLRVQGYLDVRSRLTTGRIYRIPAQPGFVTVIDWGRKELLLCAQPTRTIPAAEYVLVHKMLLEGAEEDYWKRANRLSGHMLLSPEEGTVEVWTGRGPGVLSQRPTTVGRRIPHENAAGSERASEPSSARQM
jgi:hypothetical protein